MLNQCVMESQSNYKQPSAIGSIKYICVLPRELIIDSIIIDNMRAAGGMWVAFREKLSFNSSRSLSATIRPVALNVSKFACQNNHPNFISGTWCF